jgi:UDP-N-acetylmuramate dehydrogenase
LTTICVGGSCECLIEVLKEIALPKLIRTLAEHSQPFRIIGAGSNVLISDQGLRGFLIKLGGDFKKVNPVGNGLFEIGGAASLMLLSRELSQAGWSGLEFAGGIPASLGGAVFMNAGAHGSEIGPLIQEIVGVDSAGATVQIAGKDLPWRYRQSGLPAGLIIAKVVLELTLGDLTEIKERRERCLAYRKQTQPLSQPSAGSIFKNPSPELAAGALIEQVGLRGAAEGYAEISSKHANWIVNPSKQALSREVIALIERAQREVHLQTGHRLEPELQIWRDQEEKQSIF